MEIIVATYNDPDSGIDWDEQTPEINKNISKLLDGYEKKLNFTLEEKNIGKGADWPTTAITIATMAGTLFFVIPEAHKKIRESIEEWKIIGNNIKQLIDYISGYERVVVHPIELLFISAIEHLENTTSIDNIMFEQLRIIEEPGSHRNISGLYQFKFKINNQYWIVNINGNNILISIKSTKT